MYDELYLALELADGDPQTKLIVFTGNGRYFTSGNDQNNITDPESMDRRNAFRKLVDILIEIKKPLIALVNGPAVGMGVTMLVHFDLVFASDTATFSTPFTNLGLCAEGTSSYMFPRIMGYSKAAEMLMFNRKFSAQELLGCGFVSRVFPHSLFEAQSKALIKEYAQLGSRALVEGKALIRYKEFRETLHRVNERESRVLDDLYTSPEAMEAS
ncbi:ECI2 [Bugula neritina]|uniref:ECI2 n=1 Tax=Bugula neritina TaxID=10212 RepID=A0A7J7K1Y0_BUGNE|nr:ECI2 [Bugula neritina]